MEENVKLIGLFVARTFEENNLNFIHAMQNLGKKEGYKFVIFSMDTTTSSGRPRQNSVVWRNICLWRRLLFWVRPSRTWS